VGVAQTLYIRPQWRRDAVVTTVAHPLFQFSFDPSVLQIET
jgi:hypothetical protein